MGMLHDVLMKVEAFIFPAYFMIFGYESIKHPSELKVVSVITLVDEKQPEVHVKERSSIEALVVVVIINFDGGDISEYGEMVGALDGTGTYTYAPRKLDLDLENRVTPPSRPSIEEPQS
ncbi:hypothetical protein H5410_041339 [Solanum commersonii]|uniref:Uncharacterized protein n=1 Tax=Solanum commersonii TaxID=4109 RepID=A0A9J5XRJ5_SOLCO|nr:hypothetical protein H5410_041339 [Solanum commersonii]